MSEQTNFCGCSSEEFLEDMPMKRYANPIPASHSLLLEGEAAGKQDLSANSAGRERCDGALEQIAALLTCQNQLLVDILGAVNALTAAYLSRTCP